MHLYAAVERNKFPRVILIVSENQCDLCIYVVLARCNKVWSLLCGDADFRVTAHIIYLSLETLIK